MVNDADLLGSWICGSPYRLRTLCLLPSGMRELIDKRNLQRLLLDRIYLLGILPVRVLFIEYFQELRPGYLGEVALFLKSRLQEGVLVDPNRIGGIVGLKAGDAGVVDVPSGETIL